MTLIELSSRIRELFSVNSKATTTYAALAEPDTTSKSEYDSWNDLPVALKQSLEGGLKKLQASKGITDERAMEELDALVANKWEDKAYAHCTMVF